jgi:LPS-assembly lipoprotein
MIKKRCAVFFRYFVPGALCLALAGCGFHLRGAASVTLPPELKVLRITSGGAAYPPLLVEVRNALLALGDVQITDDVSARVPVLQLRGESTQTEVLALDSNGRVSAYLLNYRMGFSLVGADGKPLLDNQAVKLQREYSFDRFNVIATEKQSEFFRTEMRRDAAQQVLRRMASLNFAPAANGHADQP